MTAPPFSSPELRPDAELREVGDLRLFRSVPPALSGWRLSESGL